MKLEIIEPEINSDGPILICDEAMNDIAEFYHNEHATVPQSYETALLLARKLVGASQPTDAIIDWAVSRWDAEVKNRPLVNVHRRTLDTTWRQIIRHFGGDDVGLCGPRHDELLDANPTP